MEAVLASKMHVTPPMLTFMENLLDESNDFHKLSQDSKAMEDLLTKISVRLDHKLLLIFPTNGLKEGDHHWVPDLCDFTC